MKETDNLYEKNILHKFKDVLGEYCTINQFVELSKRCLVMEHESEIGKRQDFIALASRYAITLTSYNAEQMVNAISRSYIVNIHLCFETFLKDVYYQVKSYGKYSFKEKQQTESWLKCVIKNTLTENIPEDIKPLIELCEYYRLIRNTAVHDLYDFDSHSKEYSKLQKYKFKTNTKFSKLSAPNSYEKISFDDFVMFSRSCIELATYIYYNISYDYKKIVTNMPKSNIATLRKYKPQRQEKYLLAYINTRFRIDDSLNNQLPQLLDELRPDSLPVRRPPS